VLYRTGIGTKIRAVSDDVAAADLIGLSSVRLCLLRCGGFVGAEPLSRDSIGRSGRARDRRAGDGFSIPLGHQVVFFPWSDIGKICRHPALAIFQFSDFIES
jgi:hypothetical protein